MSSSSSRVFLTACGVLSGGEDSVESVFKALAEDRALSGEIADSAALAHFAGLDAGDAAILERHQLLALAVVERAWKSAGLSSERNRLRGEAEKHRMAGFGCVSGSSMGGLVAMEREMGAENFGKFSPYSISRWRGNAIGAAATARYGLGGMDFSLNAASATGAQILFLAGSMVASGMLDAVVAVAADVAISPSLRSAMERGGSLTRSSAGGPLRADRSGMLPAEGSACVILESAEHVLSRGAKPLAEWLGGGCANEARHLMAPDPEARVLEDLLVAAKKQTCVGRGDDSLIDWISLHATGTPRFDAAEIACARRVFGDQLPWISAVKRTTGHALAASGLLEASLLAEGLQTGKLPTWPKNIDPFFGLPENPPMPERKPSVALQIGQGMGGTVVVNLLGSA